MIENDEQCFQTVTACNSSSSAPNNLLVTPFITSPARVINIFVEYTCPSSQSTCNTNFALHIYETPAENTPNSMVISNYETITAVVQNNTRISRRLTESGFYLAFQDTSSCVEITRVRVLYRECAETVNAFVRYPISLSGANSTGTCVSNASVQNTGPLIAQCSFEQEMLVFSGSCHCEAGFEGRNGIECTCKLCLL